MTESGNVNRVTMILLATCTFLAGIVVTLLGAWATHSVSREDLQVALASHDAIINSRLVHLEETSDKLDSLRDDMIKVKIALGIADGDAPRSKKK